jgi:hypothetical protein
MHYSDRHFLKNTLKTSPSKSENFWFFIQFNAVFLTKLSSFIMYFWILCYFILKRDIQCQIPKFCIRFFFCIWKTYLTLEIVKQDKCPANYCLQNIMVASKILFPHLHLIDTCSTFPCLPQPFKLWVSSSCFWWTQAKWFIRGLKAKLKIQLWIISVNCKARIKWNNWWVTQSEGWYDQGMLTRESWTSIY